MAVHYVYKDTRPALKYVAKNKDEFKELRQPIDYDITFVGLVYSAVAIGVAVSAFFLIIGIPWILIMEGPGMLQRYLQKRDEMKRKRELEERIRKREKKEEEELKEWRDKWRKGDS